MILREDCRQKAWLPLTEYVIYCHYASEKAMTMRKASTRTIAILAMPGVQLLDVSGPLDVFAEANVQAGSNVYRLRIVTSAPGEIESSSGARLLPDYVVSDPVDEAIDTLLVAGAPNAADIRPNPATINWLREMAPRTRRYGSVCPGAFFLAPAGLPERKHVPTP